MSKPTRPCACRDCTTQISRERKLCVLCSKYGCIALEHQCAVPNAYECTTWTPCLPRPTERCELCPKG